MFHRALKTILVVSCIMCFTRSIEGKTYWSKSVDTSQYRIPAGQERGTILHACRLKVNEDLIVGKVWTHKGSPICNSAYRGEYFGSLEFEVRSYPNIMRVFCDYFLRKKLLQYVYLLWFLGAQLFPGHNKLDTIHWSCWNQ